MKSESFKHESFKPVDFKPYRLSGKIKIEHPEFFFNNGFKMDGIDHNELTKELKRNKPVQKYEQSIILVIIGFLAGFISGFSAFYIVRYWDLIVSGF